MKEWEKEEKRLALRRGGVRTGGSGSGWRRRGDVREGTSILWEQKTAAKSFTLTEKMWEEHRKRALLDGYMPGLHITLGHKKRRLVLIEEAEFDEGHPPDRPA